MALFGKKKSEGNAPEPNSPHYNCHRESYLACGDHQKQNDFNSQPHDKNNRGGFWVRVHEDNR